MLQAGDSNEALFEEIIECEVPYEKEMECVAGQKCTESELKAACATTL